MTPAQRLLPLALALLTIALQPVHAAGAGSRAPASATVGSLGATATLASQYVRQGVREREDKPAGRSSVDGRLPAGWATATNERGLSHKLEGGWALSGSYGSAFGGAGNGSFQHYASALPRSELRPVPGSRSQRGALMMSLSRRF